MLTIANIYNFKRKKKFNDDGAKDDIIKMYALMHLNYLIERYEIFY